MEDLIKVRRIFLDSRAYIDLFQLQLFANTRSITQANTTLILRHLYRDFPSSHPTVRVVLLLQIFISTLNGQSSLNVPSFVPACKEKIEALGLDPVKRTDLLEVLANNFAPEHFGGILEFGRAELKMSRNEVEGLVQELAFRCLESCYKGKMLKRLLEGYPFLDDMVRERVMNTYRLKLDDLPPWDDEKAVSAYQAPLCRQNSSRPIGLYPFEVSLSMSAIGQAAGDRKGEDDDAMVQDGEGEAQAEGHDDDLVRFFFEF